MSHIRSVGTALPGNILSQDAIFAILDEARGEALPPRLASILRNSGIERRHLAMPVDFYLRPRSWPDRARAYEDVGTELFRKAAIEALDQASLSVTDIDAIVFVSTTGTVTPSLPSRMIEIMGFRDDTRTVPLFGYGCAGGVLGLRLAADLARADPKARILLVALELCSLAYDYDRLEKKDMIATALFADGCAAVVVSGEGDGARLGPFTQKCWPDTIAMMGWEIGDTGFDLVLAKNIPAFVQSEFAPMCDAFLDQQGLGPADLGEPACHPGGGRVVDALADYFAPGVRPVANALPATREVLRTCGNMSSPTVLFVLRALLAEKPDKPFLTTALGPGFTGAIGLVSP